MSPLTILVLACFAVCGVAVNLFGYDGAAALVAHLFRFLP